MKLIRIFSMGDAILEAKKHGKQKAKSYKSSVELKASLTK